MHIHMDSESNTNTIVKKMKKTTKDFHTPREYLIYLMGYNDALVETLEKFGGKK